MRNFCIRDSLACLLPMTVNFVFSELSFSLTPWLRGGGGGGGSIKSKKQSTQDRTLGNPIRELQGI